MFFPHKMRKLDVVILKKYVDDVTREILEFGDFEVLELSQARLNGYSLQKNHSDELFNRFLEYKRRIQAGMTFLYQGKEQKNGTILETPLSERTIQDTLSEFESEMNAWNRDMEDLKTRQHDLQIKLESISFFSRLDLDVAEARNVKHFYMGYGSVPTINYQAFMNSFSGIPSVVMNAGTIGNNSMVFFTAPMNNKEKVEKILHSLYYKDYGMPLDMKGDIKANIVRYGFELSMTHDEELWLENKFRKLFSKYLEKLNQVRLSIDYHISRARLQSEMASTRSAFLFSGWVTQEQEPQLIKKIEAICDQKCVFLDEDAAMVMMRDDVTPPTRLKNPGILRPFESLVTMFGTPNYQELDPTPVAAISYVVMFGAMFGDIGHGLILAALGGLLLLFKRFSKIKALAAIMFWVGVSSVVFGAIYGSVFGNEHIMKDIFTRTFFNPLENINTILLGAVGFGVLMISGGILLNIVNTFRLKDFGKMFFGGTGIAGLVFYWSVLALALMSMGQINYPQWLIGLPITAILIVGMEKRLEYWIFKHGERPGLGMGFFEILESVLSFLSNTISFVRVGAFALNHGALMSVVFILADMAKSPFMKGFALVVGNLFVIGFEGMVVGIQALRLEYYEFFIKFFRADGKEFQTLDIYKHES